MILMMKMHTSYEVHIYTDCYRLSLNLNFLEN